MENSMIPRLCGGVFFGLLTQLKYSNNSLDYKNVTYDNVTDPILMAELIYVVTKSMPNYKKSGFAKDVSKYRNCNYNGGDNVPLNRHDSVTYFNDSVINHYSEALNRMINFTEHCFNPHNKQQMTWLTSTLLSLIELDTIIDDRAEFYISSDACPTPKYKLINSTCVDFQALLLGILHYIISHNITNTDGKGTYELLFPSADSHIEGEYDNSILNTKNKDVLVTYLSPSEPDTALTHDVAPDLALLNHGDILYVEKNSGSFATDDFYQYLQKATEYYSTIKTLLYSETPHNFDDFYVCNDLRSKSVVGECITIDNATLDTLAFFSSYLVISGTGGIGKSMMIRHLFIESAKNYVSSGCLPILMPLKDFNTTHTSILDFVYDAIYEFIPDISLSEVEDKLKEGNCYLLLDGLDEIPSSLMDTFEKFLMKFSKTYNKAKVIVSSRPTMSFIQFNRFMILEILPFSKEKSLELIDKLDFHDKTAKAKFRHNLAKSLYTTHQQFASNPLLLTIMLMTYTTFGDIPAKRHVFYSKAYETMARLHDASKGAYVRPMHTKLTPEEFAVYFAEFCARTYKDEVLEFTEQSFTIYMSKVINHQRTKRDLLPHQFLLDLTNNLCIMYKDGEKYYFIHRSFQEYFSAVYFSTQMDDKLWKIGELFETQKRRQFGDRTFDMLYDMIPDRIDRYIFLPFLQSLCEAYDAEDGYWSFMREMYPNIFAVDGESGEYYENDPQSYLYNFIINETAHRHNGELYNIKWPDSIDYCNRKEWVTVSEPYFTPIGEQRYRQETVELNSVSSDYIYENGEPDIEGVSWDIDVDDILKNTKRFQDLIDFMENDSFPLKKEYLAMRDLYNLLNKEIKSQSDDIFDD